MAKKASIRDYPWKDAAKVLLDTDSYVIIAGSALGETQSANV